MVLIASDEEDWPKVGRRMLGISRPRKDVRFSFLSFAEVGVGIGIGVVGPGAAGVDPGAVVVDFGAAVVAAAAAAGVETELAAAAWPALSRSATTAPGVDTGAGARGVVVVVVAVVVVVVAALS